MSNISEDEIKQIKHEDPVTILVIKLKKQKLKATKKKQSAQPVNVKKILRHWARLNIIDNIHCGKSGENLHLILSSNLYSLIYEELHSNMGHLGPKSVYQLSKERFFHKNLQLC